MGTQLRKETPGLLRLDGRDFAGRDASVFIAHEGLDCHTARRALGAARRALGARRRHVDPNGIERNFSGLARSLNQRRHQGNRVNRGQVAVPTSCCRAPRPGGSAQCRQDLMNRHGLLQDAERYYSTAEHTFHHCGFLPPVNGCAWRGRRGFWQCLRAPVPRQVAMSFPSATSESQVPRGRPRQSALRVCVTSADLTRRPSAKVRLRRFAWRAYSDRFAQQYPKPV